MKHVLAGLTPRDRKALGIGIAVMLLVTLAKATPAASRGLRSLDARAAAATTELYRTRELLISEGLMRDSLAARAARLVALAPRLVPGATVTEARAELASLVALTAERHQVRITRRDERPDSAAGLFAKVSLRLEAEGDARGIAGWIAELEEGDRLLTVPDVHIQVSEPAAASNEVERLRVTMTVAGWSAPRRGTR